MINGHRKSFQAPTKAKIVTTVIVPLTWGRHTLKNRCHTFAPSTLAASSSSIGMAEKAFIMSSTFIAEHRPGSAAPSSVFCRPKFFTMMNWEMSSVSPGISMALKIMSTTMRLPQNLRRAKAYPASVEPTTLPHTEMAATISELPKYLSTGIRLKASMKLSKVGSFGNT